LRLDDMEAFCEDAERRAGEGGGGSTEDEEDEEEDQVASDDDGAVADELDAMLGRRKHKPDPSVSASDDDDDGDDDEGGGGAGGGGNEGEAMFADFFNSGRAPLPPGGGLGDAGGAALAGEDGAFDPSSDEEGDEGEEDGDQMGAPGSDAADPAGPQRLTTHQKRLARLGERVAALEEAALEDKPWHLSGEVGARARPLNSALEVDLEFERAVPPPPPPTEEGTASLEALIKARCVEGRWDDPPRPAPATPAALPPPPSLDDTRPAKGLADLYEEEYKAAATGAARPDTAAEAAVSKARAEARAVARSLFARLDALGHAAFAPPPPGSDDEADLEAAALRAAPAADTLPALVMEEATPLGAASVDRRTADEVFRPPTRRLAEAGADEATREERRRARAARKRVRRSSDGRAAGSAPSEGALPAGRKSEAVEAEGRRKKSKKGGSGGAGGAAAAPPAAPALKFSKSGALFGELQARKEAAAAGGGTGDAAAAAGNGLTSKALKL
jgi:U3 small nucleolar RNA-associated protein MPP10